jgi:hypothetical protein
MRLDFRIAELHDHVRPLLRGLLATRVEEIDLQTISRCPRITISHESHKQIPSVRCEPLKSIRGDLLRRLLRRHRKQSVQRPAVTRRPIVFLLDLADSF